VDISAHVKLHHELHVLRLRSEVHCLKEQKGTSIPHLKQTKEKMDSITICPLSTM
jgi:hypothetical protein